MPLGPEDQPPTRCGHGRLRVRLGLGPVVLLLASVGSAQWRLPRAGTGADSESEAPGRSLRLTGPGLLRCWPRHSVTVPLTGAQSESPWQLKVELAKQKSRGAQAQLRRSP